MKTHSGKEGFEGFSDDDQGSGDENLSPLAGVYSHRPHRPDDIMLCDEDEEEDLRDLE